MRGGSRNPIHSNSPFIPTQSIPKNSDLPYLFRPLSHRGIILLPGYLPDGIGGCPVGLGAAQSISYWALLSYGPESNPYAASGPPAHKIPCQLVDDMI